METNPGNSAWFVYTRCVEISLRRFLESYRLGVFSGLYLAAVPVLPNTSTGVEEGGVDEAGERMPAAVGARSPRSMQLGRPWLQGTGRGHT